jgi:hypothetical protein
LDEKHLLFFEIGSFWTEDCVQVEAGGREEDVTIRD